MSTLAFPRATIIGAGLMGHGIAVVHALGGTEVTLCDLSDETLIKAGDQIKVALATMVEAGAINTDAATAANARIHTTSDLAQALSNTDLVVEAITETIEAKRAIFELIADLAPAHALLASNTSYLDIFPVVPEALRKRTFILHWYTPAYVIDLVDVVPGPDVPKALTKKVTEYLRQQGKCPVLLKKFIPGYVANRIQMAIESEIFHLLDAGVADPSEIDCAIQEGLALRLALFGQFKKIDYTGVKLVRDSHDLGIYVPPTPPTTSKRLSQMVEDGHGGVTHGRGFYDYNGQSSADLYRERDLTLLAMKKAFTALKA